MMQKPINSCTRSSYQPKRFPSCAAYHLLVSNKEALSLPMASLSTSVFPLFPPSEETGSSIGGFNGLGLVAKGF